MSKILYAVFGVLITISGAKSVYEGVDLVKNGENSEIGQLLKKPFPKGKKNDDVVDYDDVIMSD